MFGNGEKSQLAVKNVVVHAFPFAKLMLNVFRESSVKVYYRCTRCTLV